MKKNLIWFIFLIILTLFALWFVIKAGYLVYSYVQLSAKVPVIIEKWDIKEIKSDRFIVNAYFTFEYKGKNYKGIGAVGDFFPNPWAASRAQKEFARQQLTAWLNPQHPDQAVLIKKFPLKRVISATILIGLLIYFLSLSYYVRVKHG